MKLKKRIKKSLSKLFPNSLVKERLKLLYYNLITRNVGFGLKKSDSNSVIYKTRYDSLNIFTKQPLYNTVADFDNYQFFHKVKEGDIVLDAGANVGFLSLLFVNKIGKKGHVYAFEPDKINIGMMQDNFELNKFDGHYTICEELLWNEETYVDFSESGNVASSAIWFSDDSKIVKKKAITIDSWMNSAEIKKLDFIKMDIEGAEIQAMEGCVETLLKYKPNLAIASYHFVNGEATYLWLESFFDKLGYPYVTKKFDGYEIITFAGPSVAKD
ncbi:FkbM family methyltransferase [Winogradskyella damuponensis]|uniref:Methyltransferase FkbM domain-containing protein n=1 Tax=Winogradskyella damuponensis TaxID=943939 RepID=A0ABP8CXN5_9FLAO